QLGKSFLRQSQDPERQPFVEEAELPNVRVTRLDSIKRFEGIRIVFPLIAHNPDIVAKVFQVRFLAKHFLKERTRPLIIAHGEISDAKLVLSLNVGWPKCSQRFEWRNGPARLF